MDTLERMPIRAVFFDLDDTLCNSQAAFEKGMQAAFAKIRERHPDLKDGVLEKAWHAVHKPLIAELGAGRRTMAEVRTQRLRRILAEVGKPDDAFADEADLLLGQVQLECLANYEDVAVIEKLKGEGLFVGIVTNGAGDGHPDSQRSKIKHLKLGDRVDGCWISDDMACRKPDPKAFQPALEAAGCRPEEALFVGDSVSNDIVGANLAGLISVLLLREGPWPSDMEEKRKPRYRVRTLSEVADLADLACKLR